MPQPSDGAPVDPSVRVAVRAIGDQSLAGVAHPRFGPRASAVISMSHLAAPARKSALESGAGRPLIK